MKNLFSVFVIALIITVSFTKCARKGSPSGGPIDSISPVMVIAKPEYKSVNFKEKKIKLSFDEFIRFKDLNKQLIISPPMKNAPIISPQGAPSKNITIKILDTLLENTTYSINFGNSIVDNNEGNKLGRFKYVFSTGSYVDSFAVSGKVKNAFSKETDKNVSILLYTIDEKFSDSTIYKEKPTYVTTTLDTTAFEITNIKEGKYLLVALKDFSNDYKYSPKHDKIAFIKEPITIPTDSSYTLELFKENLEYKLRRPLENRKGKIIFGFEGDISDTKIKLLSKTPKGFKSFLNFEPNKDTLNYWFTPFEADSLVFAVSRKDSIKNYTVKLRTSKIDSLEFKNTVASILHPKDSFQIQTNKPIENINAAKIALFDKDTVSVRFTPKLNKNKTTVFIDFKRQRNQNYQLIMLPNSVTSFHGKTNDTLMYNFKTVDIEEYAVLELQLRNANHKNLLIDLIDGNEVISERKISNGKTDFIFNDIKPGSYFIRVIVDENNNKKWDTGSFLKKIQPEKVIHFNTELKLRANWTVSETFTVP